MVIGVIFCNEWWQIICGGCWLKSVLVAFVRYLINKWRFCLVVKHI